VAYTLDFSIALGGGNTGLTLTAQLVDTGGANVGSSVSTGFTEIGAGNYLWHYAAFPDGHRGGVVFKSGATVKAFAAINPQEAENTDIKTSAVSAGTLTAASIWAYASRTLTQSAAQILAALGGSMVTVERGDTLAIPFTGLGPLTGRSKLWFTVKRQQSDLDSAAEIQIEEAAGLIRIVGEAGVSGNGSIVVTDATAGNLTINLAATESARLDVTTPPMGYDVQMLNGGVITTLAVGSFVVTPDWTRATS
jgi:hypothetical protein